MFCFLNGAKMRSKSISLETDLENSSKTHRLVLGMYGSIHVPSKFYTNPRGKIHLVHWGLTERVEVPALTPTGSTTSLQTTKPCQIGSSKQKIIKHNCDRKFHPVS